MKNPFKLYSGLRQLDTLKDALLDALDRPFIGVTQGGSSRRNRGAKPAATRGEIPATINQKIKQELGAK